MAMFRTESFGGNQSPLKMRGSYTRGLWDPRENDSGQAKYGCTLILPKSNAAGLELLQQKVYEAVVGEWGEKGVERFKKGLIKNPILAGDGKEAHDKTGALRAGLGPDVVFIRPTANEQVKVFDSNVILVPEPSGFPSGYWGFPVLNAFAWHNEKSGDGVSFGIAYFMVTEADEVLGGAAPDPKKFFEAVAPSADDGATRAAASGGKGAGGLFE